jgi:hypothetical protein
LKTEIHSDDLHLDAEHIENVQDSAVHGKFVKGLPVQLHTGDGLSVAKTSVAQKHPVLSGEQSMTTELRYIDALRGFAIAGVIMIHTSLYD